MGIQQNTKCLRWLQISAGWFRSRGLIWHSFKTQVVGDLFCQTAVYVHQVRDDPRTNVRSFYLAQLESERGGNMGLLDWRLADIELARLAVVVGKSFGTNANLRALVFGWKGIKPHLRSFARSGFRARP